MLQTKAPQKLTAVVIFHDSAPIHKSPNLFTLLGCSFHVPAMTQDHRVWVCPKQTSKNISDNSFAQIMNCKILILFVSRPIKFNYIFLSNNGSNLVQRKSKM
jgi:hypothetical protein